MPVDGDQLVTIEEIPEFLTTTQREELCGHLQSLQSDIFSQQDMLCEYLFAKSYISDHAYHLPSD